MTINELLLEAVQAKDRFWFVQAFEVVERTAQTITLHFIIQPTPEGMSPQPIHQFLAEVETIMLENDLI